MFSLQESEWWKGIEFLTKTGQMCDDRRQEFILLSDTLGVSMVTDLISNRKPAGATESTVFGPFHREGAPEKKYGDSIIGADRHGMVTYMSAACSTCTANPSPAPSWTSGRRRRTASTMCRTRRCKR